MNNERANLFSQLERTLEATLPIDLESSPAQESTVDTLTRISNKGVLAALGFITTLLLISGVQLYISVSKSSAHEEMLKFTRLFVFNTWNFEQEIYLKKSGDIVNHDKNKILAIQNSISHGKF